MIAISKLVRLIPQMRPVRMHREELRMRLNERAEAECGLNLSQLASHGLPVGSFSRGSVWHRSGEAA